MLPMKDKLSDVSRPCLEPKTNTFLQHHHCVNLRSARNKIAVIIDHMVDSSIGICTITETW
jgi:hypothetical protein